MADLTTLDGIEARQSAIRSRLTELNNEFAGQAFPDDIRSEWNDLNEELDRNDTLATELHARTDRVRQVHQNGGESTREAGATFHTASPTRGHDVWDYTHARAAASPESQRTLMRDQALRAVDQSKLLYPSVSKGDAEAHIEGLLERDDDMSTISRRILNTGSPLYQRAFSKAISNRPLTSEEQRALSLTGASGGYAVPYTLDPTVVPTSNHVVNPIRALANVKQITGNNWKGVTSAGVTAQYNAEATETADGAPTLVQPSIDVERADVFVPFSYEIGQDWGGMLADLAVMIEDAKDTLEATQFLTGNGSDAPYGLLTGATTVVTCSGTATFAVADLYATLEAVPPRHEPNAQWLGHLAIYNRVRQFDTAGGANNWIPNLQPGLAQGNTGYELLGKPANRISTMSSTLTTGNKIAVLGDFSRYVIVDRVGMDIQAIPHLFGASGRPTGQSGLLALWRNGAKVIDANAFRVTKTG